MKYSLLLAMAGLAGCASEPPKPDPAAVAREAKQRGYVALREGDYPAAEAAYVEAAKLLPTDPYIQLDLGVVEENLSKPDAARAAYTQAALYGKDVKPLDITDPRYAGRTVAQLAEADLAGMKPAN